LQKRISLVDPKEQVISARFLLQGEQVVTGHILDFKDHSILVGECGGPSNIPLEDGTPAPRSKLISNSRSFVQVVNSSKVLNASSLPEAPPVRWKASCSYFQDGPCSIQVFLMLRPQARQLVLLCMRRFWMLDSFWKMKGFILV
jgi:hypothetical protein